MIDNIRKYGLSFVFAILGLLGILLFFNQVLSKPPPAQTCSLPPPAATPASSSPDPQRPAEGMYMIPAPKGRGKMVITIVTTDESSVTTENAAPVTAKRPVVKKKPISSEFYVPPQSKKTLYRDLPPKMVISPKPKSTPPPLKKAPTLDEEDVYVVPLEEEIEGQDSIPGIPEEVK